MSIIKKGIKAVGKVVKGVTKFVKKHWKVIAIVALSVFTMGIATVGFAGFSGAMAAAGGGFGGFMSAVGSTMWAGVTALGGTLGLGSGASGAAAAAGNVTGAGLFSGHAAAALGSTSAKAGIAAQAAAKAGVTPLMANVGTALTGSAIPSASSLSPMIAPASSVVPPMAAPVAASTVAPAVAPTAARGLSGLGQAALITTGGQMLAGWAAGKAAEEEDPRGFWGVDLTGKGGDVAPTITERPAPPTINYPNPNAMQMMVQAPLPPGLMNAPPPEQQQPGVYG